MPTFFAWMQLREFLIEKRKGLINEAKAISEQLQSADHVDLVNAERKSIGLEPLVLTKAKRKENPVLQDKENLPEVPPPKAPRIDFVAEFAAKKNAEDEIRRLQKLQRDLERQVEVLRAGPGWAAQLQPEVDYLIQHTRLLYDERDGLQKEVEEARKSLHDMRLSSESYEQLLQRHFDGELPTSRILNIVPGRAA